MPPATDIVVPTCHCSPHQPPTATFSRRRQWDKEGFYFFPEGEEGVERGKGNSRNNLYVELTGSSGLNQVEINPSLARYQERIQLKTSSHAF